jgi:hypothetical protein
MSFGSQYNLNQRLTYLEYLLNNLPPFPPTSTLAQVLTAGSVGNIGQTITLSSALGTATYNGSTVVITDGSTTNTINQLGYTTRNSVQNSAHYLNFSDSSSTGTGAIQKTAGISCNPSLNSITATSFNGALNGNASTCTLASNVNVSLYNSSTALSLALIDPDAGSSSVRSPVNNINTNNLMFDPSVSKLYMYGPNDNSYTFYQPTQMNFSQGVYSSNFTPNAVQLNNGSGGGSQTQIDVATIQLSTNSPSAVSTWSTTSLTVPSVTSPSTLTLSTTGTFSSSISLNPTTGDLSLSSAGGGLLLTSGNGDAGFSGITLSAPQGDIALNTGGAGYSVTSNARITSTVGYQGKVYHTDQPTTNLTYYLTFVQSGGVSGYYDPAFDSATLTYNPSTNLLFVAGLQLSGSTNTGTLSAGVLTLGCNESSSRQFQVSMTSNITGLTCSNRRTNGVYTCSIYNVSGSVFTISNVLTGLNKTDYAAPIVMNNGDTAVMTIRTLLTNGVTSNYVSVSKFV